ncbi:MAG TPA: hypothetical protein VGP77_08110 [Vicinamibacterales bacterium]|jgi:hypothetical protein|nr:hypothetical protein [Vicinamibacterales bacterium]
MPNSVAASSAKPAPRMAGRPETFIGKQKDPESSRLVGDESSQVRIDEKPAGERPDGCG